MRARAAAIGLIPPSPRNSWSLEMGAGRGAVVESLMSKGYRVIACDISPNLCLHLRRQFPDARVVCCDLTDVGAEAVDNIELVTMIHVLQNLKSIDDATTAIRRLPGLPHRVVLCVSNTLSLHSMWVRAFRLKAPFVRTFAPTTVRSAFAACGYEVEKEMGVGLVTPLSARRGFRWRVIGAAAARRCSLLLDRHFPEFCHFYIASFVLRGQP